MKRILVYIAAIAGSSLAGAAGSIATTPNIPTWYAELTKPFLNPPNWVFGPVWSVLYLLMGLALAIIILKETPLKKVHAYSWYGTQLALNTLWSIVFFGMHSFPLAVATIIALIVSITATIRTFLQIDKKAGLLLVPYILWVSFAAYLTISIAFLNS